MYAEQLNDLFEVMCNAFFEKDEKRKEELKLKLCLDTIPKSMLIFENKLKLTNTGYLISDSLTWVDLYTVLIIETLGQNGKVILNKFPLISSHFHKIMNIPSIAQWIETRPKSEVTECPNTWIILFAIFFYK